MPSELQQDQLCFIAIISTIAFVLLSSFFLFRRKSLESVEKFGSSDDWSLMYKSSDSQKDLSQHAELNSSELRNVFDVKQSDPIIDESTINSSKGEKPFKSPYYYAHNSSKSNGGYKDGLKAEDYVMNKPRLLNKTLDGKESATSSAQASIDKMKDSLPINNYLWDDDENDEGIAKIIIDSLPSSMNCDKSGYISWKEAGLISKGDVKAKLVGIWKDGLILQIRSKVNDKSCFKRYHLHVPRMFGEVEEVKVIVKTKKLIIKLMKKKSKENMKPWPQLPSKVLKSAQSLDPDALVQDLFEKSNDMK